MKPICVVLVKEALKKADLHYQIHVARNGVEAAEVLALQGGDSDFPLPDLIILDLKLPRKTGRELMSEILNDIPFRSIPLVVLSSSRSELELARAMDSPGRTFMVKPSTFKEYVALVESIEAFREKAAKEGKRTP